MADEEIPPLLPSNLVLEFHLVTPRAWKTIFYAYAKTSHAILVIIANSVQLTRVEQQEQ